MTLLGVDIGTTHCKAGLFDEDGTPLSLASRPTPDRRSASGDAYYDPQQLWELVTEAIRAVAAASPDPIRALGIASMAETGLLLDQESGACRSVMIPWFDTAASAQAEQLARAGDPQAKFARMGIRPSFKCSLAKILWLREQQPEIIPGAVWLSAADYVAFRLTGVQATDYSLAGRTYAFRLDERRWDDDWLEQSGLDSAIFPPPRPAGEPIGTVGPSLAAALQLPAGVPVAICGHDHLCAAFGVGAVRPGQVFDSMGTAETLVGALAELPEPAEANRSGLTYGCHVAADRYYWLGGLSASGGSVEWLRHVLGEPPLAYEEMMAMLAEIGPEPSGILYFPYLAGSGSPQPDPAVRAAFIGLNADHHRADLVKAVLEGTAYEIEAIRRAAEAATGMPIEMIIAAGGGTRNRYWLQMKADISGSRYEVSSMPEATLRGAALLAGLGAGIYADETAALAAARDANRAAFTPDAARHSSYRHYYEQGYCRLQKPLRETRRQLASDNV